jgi:ADP-ribosyl-[dinitrogen reductase] hydrolase
MQANDTATRAALLGLAVGDALGVPVEFQPRATRFGTHSQPAGTWSDDASLTFCLAETLAAGGDVADAAARFLRWYEQGYWTPHGRVFDIGIATAEALRRIKQGTPPTESGGRGEYDNGNGALMRILPLVFVVCQQPAAERFRRVQEFAGITHGHIRSTVACFIYVEMACQLLQGADILTAYQAMQHTVREFLQEALVASAEEIQHFHRILAVPGSPNGIQPLASYPEADIHSSGYVIHTLEAILWCLLKHDTYAATVLAAVNLGEDTDTTGAIAGGLAGLAYGEAAIPEEWRRILVRRADIEALALRLASSPG